MHRETISSLIESGSGAVGAFLKEVLVHRKEMDRLEHQKEKEIELAKVRSQAAADDDTQETVEAVTQTQGTPPAAEIEAAIDELMADETCSVCRELLEGLKDRPPREQVIGVAEYGTFKRELSGDADVADLRDYLEHTQVLLPVLEEHLSAPV